MSHEDIKKRTIELEGKVSHMYLDTKGNVTVGIGAMLVDVNAAKKLGFVTRDKKSKATLKQIEDDFNNVKKQPKGKIASAYKKHTKLDLPETVIDALFSAHVKDFKNQLRSKYSGFDTFPEEAQEALLDMAFNLGTHALKTKWPKLNKEGIDKRDWKAAAKHCNRPYVSLKRNEMVKELFEKAAEKVEKKSGTK
jgi:GH24 family phage-related lysozyme (muramidase)